MGSARPRSHEGRPRAERLDVPPRIRIARGHHMELTFSPELEAFRKVARDFLETNLTGKFEALKGRGGPGDEDFEIELRIEWGKVMGKAGWNCVSWPKKHGGRELSLLEEVIWNEEYVRA